MQQATHAARHSPSLQSVRSQQLLQPHVAHEHGLQLQGGQGEHWVELQRDVGRGAAFVQESNGEEAALGRECYGFAVLLWRDCVAGLGFCC